MTNPFDQLLPHAIIPMEDDFMHTAANGYKCGDPICYCADPSDPIHTEPNVVEGSLSYVVDENYQLN